MRLMKTFMFAMLCALPFFSVAQSADDLKKANNPLADMTAISFHNYYMAKLSEAPTDAFQNTGWVRFAKPFAEGKLLLRASLPLNTLEMSGESASGLGDLNAFLSYNFITNDKMTMGAGPLVVMPTATNEILGAEKWQAGLMMVAFATADPVFQYGALVTWQHSFAGDSDRSTTNMLAFQPFLFWQVGSGYYLRNSGIWAFDFENDAYSVPMGVGVGKVVKMEKTMFNIFCEPQYSMLRKGTQPQFQVFIGINVQLL